MQFTIPIKRLGSDSNYIRPEKTITELLQTKKEIESQLDGFEEITEKELTYLNINTQLKYISFNKQTKKEQFRFGGLLVSNKEDYAILAGKEGMRFSVQKKTLDSIGNVLHITRFFRKIRATELLQSKLDDTIETSTSVIDKQQKVIEKQKKELADLKKKLGLK